MGAAAGAGVEGEGQEEKAEDDEAERQHDFLGCSSADEKVLARIESCGGKSGDGHDDSMDGWGRRGTETNREPLLAPGRVARGGRGRVEAGADADGDDDQSEAGGDEDGGEDGFGAAGAVEGEDGARIDGDGGDGGDEHRFASGRDGGHAGSIGLLSALRREQLLNFSQV